MVNVERILKQERLIRAMTGLNRKGFGSLLVSFEEAYRQSLIKPESKRQRAIGGGRKSVLRTIGDKTFYIDHSCAHDWVHRLLPILETALGYKQVLPERKISSIAEFLEKYPEVKEVIIDGTERPVQRPKDAEKQVEHYSEKKKRHTRKHTTGSTRKKRVITSS